MATQKGSGTTKKPAAKRAAAKKCATRKCAPKVAAEPAPTPAPAPAGDRLTEVARTIGSTMGALAVTAKRALGHSAGKK